MPYAADHKPRTRARILDAASAEFAANGYDRTSIECVMKRAELTRGAFYAHFDSKEELFLQTILMGVVEDASAWASFRSDASSELEAQLAAYLADPHVEGERGCPLITFPSEVARGTDALKAAYENVALSIKDRVKSEVSADAAEDRALAILAMIVGAATLSRGVQSKELSKRLRRASLRFGCALAKTDT